MSEKIIREVVSGMEAKHELLKGLKKCADIVGDTMGYFGNNNLFESIGGLPNITSDGWDSLEQLHFEEPLMAMAAEILKEAARKTRDEVGDQTTTTTVLTHALFENSLKALESGRHSIEIKNELEKSLAEIVAFISDLAVPATDKMLYDIAKTSAHGDDEIAAIVQEAFISAGEYGMVTHQRGFTDETKVENIEGTLIDAGFADERFINVPETQSVVFDNNPLVLCSDTLFETPKEIIPFFEYAAKLGRDLVIIAPLGHHAKNTVLANFLPPNNFNFVAVNPPLSGKMRTDALSDLALACGGKLISGVVGTMLEGKEHIYLGSASKVEINATRTIVYPCESVDQTPVRGKIEDLKAYLKTVSGLYEQNSIKERISKLAGKISTIKVGGCTESEINERMARMEDAIEACKAAKEEGVVAGGGVVLRNAAIKLDIDDVMIESITAPFERIIENAGMTEKVLHDLDKEEEASYVLSYPFSYDVSTGDVVDMFQAGVIDSAKGIRCSLINAVSASNNILRTNNILPFKRQKNG